MTVRSEGTHSLVYPQEQRSSSLLGHTHPAPSSPESETFCLEKRVNILITEPESLSSMHNSLCMPRSSLQNTVYGVTQLFHSDPVRCPAEVLSCF